MAALIRTWLLFLHTGRGRLNEPLGVDYDTCAKSMNRLRMVVGARLTNWKGDGAYVFQVLHALHVDVRPSHFVRFTSCDGGTTKQREGKVLCSLPLPRRLPFDRLHRSVVPADPTDEEDVESVGRQMPLHLRRKQAASERASERAAVVERRSSD